VTLLLLSFGKFFPFFLFLFFEWEKSDLEIDDWGARASMYVRRLETREAEGGVSMVKPPHTFPAYQTHAELRAGPQIVWAIHPADARLFVQA
jgi:hypothetical protein